MDRNALVEQLSRLDVCVPEDASITQAPSTVWGLKAELDTLIGQLREPAEPDPFANESGLRRAQELVLAIGVEPKTCRDRLESGQIGPYELLESLGQGGMGVVYKAMHSSLERIVALKILPPDRLNPQAISRFQREMKAVGKLDHPNIVRATDAGEVDGKHFLVMEYVDGVDLSKLLRSVGPLAAADACELVRQAAIGLQHAHQRGLVHRDIKPSNIMLAWSEEHAPAVKILDLALALLSEQSAPIHGDLTTTGQLFGSLEYMSPEQSMDTHHVDIRSDIEFIDIGDSGLEHLKSLKMLAHFHVRVAPRITAEGIQKFAAVRPGCRITWDGGVIEPRPIDPDRRAAEYVLSIGGHIRFNEIEQSIGAVDDLPQGDFEPSSVNLESNPNVSDVGLASFNDCRNLKSINLCDTKSAMRAWSISPITRNSFTFS